MPDEDGTFSDSKCWIRRIWSRHVNTFYEIATVMKADEGLRKSRKLKAKDCTKENCLRNFDYQSQPLIVSVGIAVQKVFSREKQIS